MNRILAVARQASLLLGLLFLTSAAQAALELQGEINPDPVRPGERIRVEFTVINTGVAAEDSVSLEVLLPAGLTAFNDGPNENGLVLGGGDCPGFSCESGEEIVWALGTIAAGEARTVTFWPFVGGGTADDTLLSFDAEVFDGGAGLDDSLSAVATVETGPVFTLAVEDDADPVLPGDTLRYNITYGNPGTLPTSATTLTLPLPADTTFVSATGGGSESGGTVTWNIGALTPGESGEYQVEVTVSNSVSAGDVLVVDAASIAGSTVEAVPVAVQNDAQALTQVAAASPLQLVMEVNPDPVVVGERMYVNFTVANVSGVALSGITLQTRIDGVASFTDAPQEGADVLGEGTCSSFTCDDGELLTWAIGDLAANSAVTVGYWSTASAQNDGELIELEAWVTDSAGAEAIASQAVAVYDAQALALAIEDNVDPVVVDGIIDYTLTYSNFGLLAVSGATIEVPLPDGATFVSASDGGSESGGVVSWALGALLPATGGELQLELDVTGIAAGEVVAIDAARLAGTTVEAVPRAVRAIGQAATQIVSSSPIGLAITVNPDPVRSTEEVRVEFTVTNTSGSTLFGTELQARIPDGLLGFTDAPQETADVFGQGTCASFTCDATELITYSLGDLAVGASTTVGFWTSAGNLDTGSLIRFDSNVTDSVGNEASDSRTILVDNEQELALSLDADLNPVQAGDELTYTLVYGNLDASAATSSVLTLPLPDGTTFVSATDGGMESGGLVMWNLETIPAGASGKVSATVTVDGGVVNGDLLEVKKALLQSASGFAIRQHVVRAAASGIAVSVEANPDAVRPDQLIRNEFTVTNTSGFTLFNVQLQVRVPRGVDSFSDTPSESADVIGEGTCASSTCDPTELITWSFGNLPADAATTVAFWTDIQSSTGDAELIILDARATADAGNETAAGKAVPIDSDSALTLAIDESADTIANGETLEYTLVFGNRSLNPVTNVVIELPIPDGLTYASSALGNPVVSSDNVVWNIGDVLAGEGGTVKAAFQVTGASAEQLEAEATIIGDDQERRASAVTRVLPTASLGLEVDILAPNQPDDTTTVTFDVTNNTAFTLFGVTLQTRVPVEFDSFSEGSDIVGGGTCASTTCDDDELVTWALGNLSAGQMVTVSYETDVDASLTDGQLITVDAYVTEDVGSQKTDTETVLIGPDSDADQDGISDTYEETNGLNRNDPSDALGDEDSDGLLNIDEFLLGTGLNDPDSDTDTVLDGADNCVLDSNPDQADNEGDGLGDVCDTDDDNDGILDVDDNCQFVVNNDQADGDGDGEGNACEPPPLADVTEAGDTSGDGDIAVLLQGDATGSEVQIIDAASGAVLNTIDFFTWAWEPIAIDTITDGDSDGTADDPAIALLARRGDNGQIKVQFRRVSNGGLLRANIGFFNSGWTPIDVAVVNDINGDGTTGDTGIAVLAENNTTGRIEIEMVPLDTLDETPTFKQRFFSPDWTPVAAEALVPAGGGESLLTVVARNDISGKTVLQRRQVSNGLRLTNIFAFGSAIDPSDVTVAEDGDANGTADDPAVVFYGTKLSTGNSVVRSRSVANGARLDEFRILGSSFLPERVTMLPDASGDNINDVAGTARDSGDDELILKARDYASGGNVSNIFPSE